MFDSNLSNPKLPFPSCFGVSHSFWNLKSRSEEHTSELQSRPHLVCRLLLEKKKNNKNYAIYKDTKQTASNTRDAMRKHYRTHATQIISKMIYGHSIPTRQILRIILA